VCSNVCVHLCSKMCLRNRHGEDCDVAHSSGKWVCPRCRGSCGAGCVTCCNCGPCRKKVSRQAAPAASLKDPTVPKKGCALCHAFACISRECGVLCAGGEAHTLMQTDVTQGFRAKYSYLKRVWIELYTVPLASCPSSPSCPALLTPALAAPAGAHPPGGEAGQGGGVHQRARLPGACRHM
jgi:hypothetical protein